MLLKPLVLAALILNMSTVKCLATVAFENLVKPMGFGKFVGNMYVVKLDVFYNISQTILLEPLV